MCIVFSLWLLTDERHHEQDRHAALHRAPTRCSPSRADTQVGPYIVASSAIAAIIAFIAGSGIARIARIACTAYGRTRVCARVVMLCSSSICPAPH